MKRFPAGGAVLKTCGLPWEVNRKKYKLRKKKKKNCGTSGRVGPSGRSESLGLDDGDSDGNGGLCDLERDFTQEAFLR